MFSLLAALALSTSVIIEAEGENNKVFPFASVEFADKSSITQVSSLLGSQPTPKNIKAFIIRRNDGTEIVAPAPQNFNSITFRLTLMQEEPVSFEAIKAYGNSGPKATVIRARPMPMPVMVDPSQEKPSGGIMGMLPIIIMIFLFMRFCRGQKAQ